MIYTIEADNNITPFASANGAKAAMSGGYEQFGSAKELAKLASDAAPHATPPRMPIDHQE